MRIGHGYDVHAFGPGDHVVVGGVRIAHDRGIEAHSDGDVLLHAVCDALLGAAGLGDIGRHFPDGDTRFRNADSRELVRDVMTLLAKQGLRPVSVDTTVVAQAPRLAGAVPRMREILARDLSLSDDRANVKATTTERLGPIGREEGIAAHAVVLVDEVPGG